MRFRKDKISHRLVRTPENVRTKICLTRKDKTKLSRPATCLARVTALQLPFHRPSVKRACLQATRRFSLRDLESSF